MQNKNKNVGHERVGVDALMVMRDGDFQIPVLVHTSNARAREGRLRHLQRVLRLPEGYVAGNGTPKHTCLGTIDFRPFQWAQNAEK